MKVILNTHSDDPNYNGDCDYAVIDLTPELISQIRRRFQLVHDITKQDADLWELYFWGGTAEFYSHELLEACGDAAANAAAGDINEKNVVAAAWIKDFESREAAELPIGVNLADLEDYRQRTECDQMIIRGNSYHEECVWEHYDVVWTASPKHSDLYVTTAELPLRLLEAAEMAPSQEG